MCVSVCLKSISSKTAERIWLKFCTGAEVVLDTRAYASNVGGDYYKDPAQSVVFLVLLFGSHYFVFVRQMAAQLH